MLTVPHIVGDVFAESVAVGWPDQGLGDPTKSPYPELAVCTRPSRMRMPVSSQSHKQAVGNAFEFSAVWQVRNGISA